jgi:hypothetical protein
MTPKAFAVICAASLALWAVVLAGIGFVPWEALPFLGAVVLAVLAIVALLVLAIHPAVNGDTDGRH